VAGYSLTVDLKAELANFQRGMDSANRSLDKLESEAGKTNAALATMGKTAGALAAGLAAAFGAREIIQAANATAAWADSLENAVGRVGVASETLQALRYEADKFGASTDQVDTALQRFSRRLGQARSGGGELLKILQQYNIALRDQGGAFRSVEVVLRDYARLLNATGDAAERNAIAMAAFDSEGVIFGQALGAIGGNIDTLNDALRAQNKIVSDESVAAWDRAYDAVNDFMQDASARIRESSGQWLRWFQAIYDDLVPPDAGDKLVASVEGFVSRLDEINPEINLDTTKAQKQIDALNKRLESIGMPQGLRDFGDGLDLADVWQGIRDLAALEGDTEAATKQFEDLTVALEKLAKGAEGSDLYALQETARQLKEIGADVFDGSIETTGYQEAMNQIAASGDAAWKRVAQSARASAQESFNAIFDLLRQLEREPVNVVVNATVEVQEAITDAVIAEGYVP
jgi:hypothetical protein